MSGDDATGWDWKRLMVKAGLWDKCPKGFKVHDYLTYNPTKAKVLEDRGKIAERVRRYRVNGNGVTPHVSNSVSNATVTRSRTRPKDKVKDFESKAFDSDVDVTARAPTPDDPGSGSTPGVLDQEHPRRRLSAGSGPTRVGAMIGGALKQSARCLEILERVKAERPDLDPTAQETAALEAYQREVRGVTR
jgi:hypothetical protein